MKCIKYVKYISIFCAVMTANNAFSAGKTSPVRINNFLIPAFFVSALKQGMSVPVYIRYTGNTMHNRSEQKIADVMLNIQGGEFYIKQIILDEQQQTGLSPALKSRISKLKDVSFGDGERLNITDKVFLTLETKSFYIELHVDRDALVPIRLNRINMLDASSGENATNILNYTFGSYYNRLRSNSSSSAYLTVDNISAWREHHISLNGSAYSIGTEYNTSEIYRAMYERDYNGYRLAIGMVDTWNLQSIANINALNSSRIYGASFGNRSNTRIEDNTLSILPVIVFLPSVGEVHIYRDNRLLSIQNFPMGSYELDTKTLPFGVYNVDVQVVVNGKVVNRHNAQINKTFSGKSSSTDELTWQIFAGTLDYNKTDYRSGRAGDRGSKETWISGLAMATNHPWLSGVNLKYTIYGFDNIFVNESEANIVVNDVFNINQQMLLASDSSRRSISTVNFILPQGYGSLWGARQASNIGNRLMIQKDNAWSIGITANLKKISRYLGVVTASKIADKRAGNKYFNVDYNQSILSNRYASVSLRTGMQNYNYNGRHKLQDKYVNIDIMVPLSTGFSAGVSSNRGNILANATMRKILKDNKVNQLGATLSKVIASKDGNSYSNDELSATGYAFYETKYNSGNFSASISSDHSSAINMSSQGSIGIAKDNIAMGKGSQNAGIMIKTDFSGTESLLANVNGRSYPLRGSNNYISLPPYKEYEVELMNDKNSENSLKVMNGRQARMVLYPGNIGVMKPEIKQLVTVFGRIKKHDGTPFANINIYHRTGSTRTDEWGKFAVDIDKKHPDIAIMDGEVKLYETRFDLQDAYGAIWIGDIYCPEN